jgi:hypothetical protein
MPKKQLKSIGSKGLSLMARWIARSQPQVALNVELDASLGDSSLRPYQSDRLEEYFHGGSFRKASVSAGLKQRRQIGHPIGFG